MGWSSGGSKSVDVIKQLREQVRELQAELARVGSRDPDQQRQRIFLLERQVELLRSRENDGLEQLRDALVLAKQKLQEQDILLKQLTAHPSPYATVLYVHRGRGGYAVILFDGKQLEVDLPIGIPVESGDTVKVSADTSQIIDVVHSVIQGQISTVVQVLENNTCEIEHTSGRRVISVGRFVDELEKGDRIVLDASDNVIVQNLGKKEDRFQFMDATNISWADIGGLQEAKRLMIETIEFPYKYPDIHKHYNKKPVKGVLLYGPPGCGKTLLAKATATSIAAIHNGGKSLPSGFLYVKGPEILSRWVGDAEATIRQLFARARAHKQEHGFPAVIFIDEAEAILRKRGSGLSSDMESTIVPMFLAEMDGLNETGAITILATNRPDVLDPAVVRDGRIDRKIRITRPNEESAREIFALHLKGVPFYDRRTVAQMAVVAAKELYSPDRVLYRIQAVDRAGVSATHCFTLAHIVNGGMIAGVVDQAISFALQWDLGKKTKTGLRPEDFRSAVDSVFKQNVNLDHQEALEEFLHDVRVEQSDIKHMKTAEA